jgi:hypothetical protein
VDREGLSFVNFLAEMMPTKLGMHHNGRETEVSTYPWHGSPGSGSPRGGAMGQSRTDRALLDFLSAKGCME